MCLHDAKANNFDADDNEEDEEAISIIVVVVVLCALKEIQRTSHKDKFASVFTMRKYVTKGVVTPMMIIISSTSSSSSVSKVKDKRKEVIAENSSSSFLDNETAAYLDRNVYVIQKGSRPTQHSFLCYRTLYFFKFSCAWRDLTEKR